MTDEYIGNLNVAASAELNPYLMRAGFSNDSDSIHFNFCENQSPLTPTCTAEEAAAITRVVVNIRNDGDETIEAKMEYTNAETKYTTIATIAPGANEQVDGGLLPGAMTVGEHMIGWTLQARVPGATWKNYLYDGGLPSSTTYTVQEEPCTVTCALDNCPNTLGITTGCDLLKHCDTDNDGNISVDEFPDAILDYVGGKITSEEFHFVQDCYGNYSGNINTKCPGCYTPSRLPPCGNYGDVDDDGYVTMNDATLVGKYVVGGWAKVSADTPLSETEFELRAEVNADGVVDMADSSYIGNYAAFTPGYDTFPICGPNGDITSVTLDGKLLTEGGTLDWVLNDDAHVRVSFRNTGNTASTFRIWLTDESGSTITGCDITTGSIPADSGIYYVDLCIFLPTVVKVKTLTVHITP